VRSGGCTAEIPATLRLPGSSWSPPASSSAGRCLGRSERPSRQTRRPRSTMRSTIASPAPPLHRAAPRRAPRRGSRGDVAVASVHVRREHRRLLRRGEAACAADVPIEQPVSHPRHAEPGRACMIGWTEHVPVASLAVGSALAWRRRWRCSARAGCRRPPVGPRAQRPTRAATFSPQRTVPSTQGWFR